MCCAILQVSYHRTSEQQSDVDTGTNNHQSNTDVAPVSSHAARNLYTGDKRATQISITTTGTRASGCSRRPAAQLCSESTGRCALRANQNQGAIPRTVDPRGLVQRHDAPHVTLMRILSGALAVCLTPAHTSRALDLFA
ncbi:Os01g0779602 [Oryza sativa Japonica Group]|uniref:Os01g0779602 protein n=1 Tax=Oryza sativa subsp. japonica TaxID=39947 RepID=A0A0P0V900_ORYSJ|nr:Os01g0779602 [Oryza sativa Japonica Group]